MVDEPHAPSVPPDHQLRELCDEAKDLVRGLPAGVRRLSVRAGDAAVDIEWDPDAVVAGATAAATVPIVEGDGRGEATSSDGYVLSAPLVGAFYRSPKPGAPPFVEVGDVVEAGQQVAIIEAMKIMNAIQTERAGTVREILASDGDVVEFGQGLMLIEPVGDG